MFTRIRVWVIAGLLFVLMPARRCAAAASAHRRRGGREFLPDRGDVPGWVLITVMTAALVVALWALAGEAFTSLFVDSINKVRQAG